MYRALQDDPGGRRPARSRQPRHPPHPAATLREDVLPALGLSVAEAARQLGISRVQLSRVINEHSGISADLALRLEDWLATEQGGPSAESWLRGQAAIRLCRIGNRICEQIFRSLSTNMSYVCVTAPSVEFSIGTTP